MPSVFGHGSGATKPRRKSFICPFAASRSNGSGGDRVISSAVLLVHSEVQEIRRTIYDLSVLNLTASVRIARLPSR
jgi:hypothetical protein